MAELVTDAAIDAASEAVFANRGLSDDPLIPVLNAAAPHIAAAALRDAAQQVYDRFYSHTSTDAQTIVYMIARMADELERE